VKTHGAYFEEFFKMQTQIVKDKIIWTLTLIEEIEHVPVSYLKHLQDDLYEIRVRQGSNIFRIFCFFDEGSMIVLMNGFQKKSRKTPKQEIIRALQIKKEYENEKK
jgi:phage-related protein